ncbi:MAG: DUF2892 domain-containing protein [Flavobacteriales bacterium]|jgi:hypothetical protein
MKPNMGKVDRSIRAVLGLLLVASGLYYDMWFWAVGVVFLLTAAFRWCPLYRLFGVNTCEVRSKG